MHNPLVVARERKHIAQRDLAKKIGVSQQFIQRHEVGAAAQLPYSLSAYWDSQLSRPARLDMLADMLEEVSEHHISGLASYYYPTYNNHAADFANLYKLYVHVDRLLLPNLFTLTTMCKTRGDLLAMLLDKLEAETLYQLACKLHLNPYVLAGLFEPNHFNLTKPLSLGIPEPVVLALNESGVNLGRV